MKKQPKSVRRKDIREVLSRPEVRRRLAKNLERLLEDRGENAFSLSKKLGIGHRCIYRALRETADISASLLYNVAVGLEVPMERLLEKS